MSLLDFIKNRGAQTQAAEAPSQRQTETAKQMSTREAAEHVPAKPSELVRPDQQARMAEAQALYSKGTQEAPSSTPVPTPAPEGATNPQPMQQQGIGQDKVAPEMTPTSSIASARAQDVEGPSAPASTPTRSQQQTTVRSAPSWER